MTRVRQFAKTLMTTIGLLTAPFFSDASTDNSDENQREVTASEVQRWMSEISNWGRWATDSPLLRQSVHSLGNADVRSL